jgi:hydroxymethylpyrimidine/phosphomethylpyrimidine kinase
MDRGDARAVSDRTPVALTIAGSDSGGGAGIQADLKTFAALGVYAASAITALTAQNTLGVSAIHFVPATIVAAQIEAALVDFDVAAIKIGMLGSAEIVEAAAGCVQASRKLAPPLTQPLPAGGERGAAARASPLPVHARQTLAFAAERQGEGRGDWPQAYPHQTRPFLVYDPVMKASSGDALAEAGFAEATKARLLPLIDCLTPNLAEAAALLGAPLARDEAEMARQGAALLELGPRAVLIKGGHLAGAEAVDLLVTADAVRRFAAPRVASRNLHGTGCTLSSAIAAHIVLGASLPEAVAAAKEFVRGAIERGRDARLGAGAGPLLQGPLRPAITGE